MKYTISLYGKGNELSIGTIPEKTWKYIEETFDGDEQEYLDALDNGDVPEEFQLACDSLSINECDDLEHHHGCWSSYFRLTVEDEYGNEVFSCTDDDIDGSNVKTELNCYSIDDNIPHLAVWSSVGKGTYLEGEFEVDGDFDPSKLKMIYERTCWNHDEDCDTIVSKFEYDGKEIDAEFSDSEGKGDTLMFVTVEPVEEDEEVE